MEEREYVNPQTVRVKRNNRTYFIVCDEYDVVQTLKGRLASIVERPSNGIKLFKHNRVREYSKITVTGG